ncbi:helix-turn-helix domain-containing protein [Chitinophaga dinghuensis]|uniref:helix-turn-helix domain-containing protein n=1 Tax=Chitinophaga dinghuensis TaxID=1539050 RepID=UPI001474CC4B|nr:AraC family transcriptional regulator [Chitinophaga dinghuensis]
MDITAAAVTLGKISFPEELDANRHKQLSESLYSIGLEIIESRVNQLVEGIKQCVRDYLVLRQDDQQYKLSSYVSNKLAYDFGYLSDVFSKMEGITVERYFMLQRLEKVKELLDYDQLSLSEIAFEVGFSSVHHLSTQFKKITGTTPTQYKQLAIKERQCLDLIGA